MIVLNVTINLIDGLAFGGLLFLLAVGLTMIFGLVDVLNLAHGAFYMVSGYLALMVLGGGAPSLAMFAGLLVLSALVGGVLGLGLNLTLKPLGNRGHLEQALLTLGLSMVLAEAVLHLAGRGFRSILPPAELRGSIMLGEAQFPTYRLVVIGVSAVLALATYLVFEKTKLGSLTRAAIDDPEMLAGLGYDVRKIRVGVIATGSALAGVAGLLGAPLLNLRPGLDNEVLTLALIVIVVGGLGSIKGAALGAVLIGLIQTLGQAYLPQVAAFMLFGLMVLVLLVRPRGLFGRAA
ncbi:branched-chain amino acid ABC transporter permease [Enemella sp. A6]|uniref:branched-chain amino acid ABC transporter permease n=1 Tax=Enemella sp. A6 TaxID=3440152 RepID=UPI003EB81EE2